MIPIPQFSEQEKTYWSQYVRDHIMGGELTISHSFAISTPYRHGTLNEGRVLPFIYWAAGQGLYARRVCNGILRLYTKDAADRYAEQIRNNPYDKGLVYVKGFMIEYRPNAKADEAYKEKLKRKGA